MAVTVSFEPSARLRVDKWLWAARFFKTRSLAITAIDKGRVRIGGSTVKPAREVRIGETLEVEIEGVAREVHIKGICETRGPAPIAQTMYEETPESVERRRLESERRRLFREPAQTISGGRPTKRERRVIDKLSDEP